MLTPKEPIPIKAIVPTSANSPIALIAIPQLSEPNPPTRTKPPPIVPVEVNNPTIVGAAK